MHGDAGLTDGLRGVGEQETLDVGFLDVGQVGETDAAAVDAEKEHVAGKGHGTGVGQVGIAHASQLGVGQ